MKSVFTFIFYGLRKSIHTPYTYSTRYTYMYNQIKVLFYKNGFFFLVRYCLKQCSIFDSKLCDRIKEDTMVNWICCLWFIPLELCVFFFYRLKTHKVMEVGEWVVWSNIMMVYILCDDNDYIVFVFNV